MTQLLHEQMEQKLNCLLDIPKHIGKRTPKKLSDHFFVKLSRIAIAMYMFVSDSNWNSYRFRLLDQFIFVDRDTKYFVQSVPADWVSWICSYKYKYNYKYTNDIHKCKYNMRHLCHNLGTLKTFCLKESKNKLTPELPRKAEKSWTSGSMMSRSTFASFTWIFYALA